MKGIAEFAIRRRWWVIVGWIAVIVLAQGIASALGGAAYKDTFSLPNTETATVTNLLKSSGLSGQSGATGTVVLKNTSNAAFTGAPAQLEPTLTKVCTSGNFVSVISTPWQSINCSNPAAVGPGNPKLLNTARGSNTALVNISWQNNHFDPETFKNVYIDLKTLRSPSLQVEFTGNAFAGVEQETRLGQVGVHRLRGGPDHPGTGVPYDRRDRAAPGQRRLSRWSAAWA